MSVPEGNSGNTTVNMCLELTDDLDGLRRDVVVNIATQDRTACKLMHKHYGIKKKKVMRLCSILSGLK
jgi:hypothetical protein